MIPYYKPAYVYGGPVRSSAGLFEALAEKGVRVTVLTTDANGSSRLQVPLRQPVDVRGVEVHYFPVIQFPPRRFFYSPEMARAVAVHVRSHGIAVLDTLFTHATAPAARACVRAGLPYIVPLRGQLLPWALRHGSLKKRLYMSLLGKRFLNGAAALYCTDHSELSCLCRLGLRAPAFVVPNGVDAPRYADLPRRGTLRAQLGIPSDAAVLLFLGRLHAKKRPDVAVDTLALVRSYLGKVHLVVVGPDEQHLAQALVSRAHQLGCAEHLHIVGLLNGDDILQAFADANLLLMPSEADSENFGMAAVEAMAAGLPVVVSDGVPVGRWVEAAAAGRMVPCTTTAFARAVLDLLSSSGKSTAAGERGQQVVRQHFDLPVVAEKMLAHFRSIVTRGVPLAEPILAYKE